MTTEAATTTEVPTIIAELIVKHYLQKREGRIRSLVRAHTLGADAATLDKVATAGALGYHDEGEHSPVAPTVAVKLRYAGLSRGKGWARHGKGDSAHWGKIEGDYAILDRPGSWALQSHDGFRREERRSVTVEYFAVGSETWAHAY